MGIDLPHLIFSTSPSDVFFKINHLEICDISPSTRSPGANVDMSFTKTGHVTEAMFIVNLTGNDVTSVELRHNINYFYRVAPMVWWF